MNYNVLLLFCVCGAFFRFQLNIKINTKIKQASAYRLAQQCADRLDCGVIDDKSVSLFIRMCGLHNEICIESKRGSVGCQKLATG